MKVLDMNHIYDELGASTDDQKMLVSGLVYSIFAEPTNNTGAHAVDPDIFKKAIFGEFAQLRPIDVEVYILATSWSNDFEDIAQKWLTRDTGSIFGKLFDLLDDTSPCEGVKFNN